MVSLSLESPLLQPGDKALCVQVVTLCKSYFGGEFSEQSIKNNFVLIYELLDEIMDFGYPQVGKLVLFVTFLCLLASGACSSGRTYSTRDQLLDVMGYTQSAASGRKTKIGPFEVIPGLLCADSGRLSFEAVHLPEGFHHRGRKGKEGSRGPECHPAGAATALSMRPAGIAEAENSTPMDHGTLHAALAVWQLSWGGLSNANSPGERKGPPGGCMKHFGRMQCPVEEPGDSDGRGSSESVPETRLWVLQVTGAVGWRKDSIKYKKNEVFLDIVEQVNMLTSSKGNVLRCDVNGKIVMKVFLSGMPDVKLGLNDKLEVRCHAKNTLADVLLVFCMELIHARDLSFNWRQEC